MQRSTLALALAALCTFAGAALADEPEAATETEGETGFRTFAFDSVVYETERRYGMWIPHDYPASDAAYPLILFLHGYGECGDDTTLVKEHGPIKVAEASEDFPFLVVAPQVIRPKPLEVGNAWRKLEPDLMLILDRVKRDFRVDESRIYLTGISMGGFGTFAISSMHPELFAAVAPICGGGSPALADTYSKTAEFRIYHGEKDPLVPVRTSKTMHEAMTKAGVKVELILYPEALHDSWTETYENPEFWEWLLSNRLAPATDGGNGARP